MNCGSLFTGIGGFDLGFERAGILPAWQVEIDKDCTRVLTKHFQATKRYMDVTQCERLADVDVLCGGFPCQDLSVAGQRKGLAGKRSGLWFEFLRIIKLNRPRFVVIENVPGLLSSDKGRDFAAILRGLVGCGYGVAWRILDAQYFGLAQRRKRLFIVGSLGSGNASQILFESEGGRRNSETCTEARTAVAPILEVGARTNGDGDRDGDGIGSAGDPMYTLQSGKQHGVAFVAGTLLSVHNETGGTRPPGSTVDNVDTLIVAATLKQRGRGACDEVMDNLQVADCLTRNYGKQPDSSNRNAGPINLIAFTERSRAGGRTFESQDELAYALTNPGAGGRTQSRSIAGDFGVRRLTPRECERLQGFPDDWTLYDFEQKQMSDSARYRMLGNAVAVPCAQWIGARLMGLND